MRMTLNGGESTSLDEQLRHRVEKLRLSPEKIRQISEKMTELALVIRARDNQGITVERDRYADLAATMAADIRQMLKMPR